MTPDDMTLVREFVTRNSEPAFATLVERYVGLVHSAALRQTGDTHLAEEITQAVFVILARKAATLGKDTILPAWLYRTARYATGNALKIQRRRRVREQEAYMQSTLQTDDPTQAWQQLAPQLDDTMAQLSERDRASLVLRYFENRPWREVAELMQVKEDAAQKRVTRALDKLRRLFARRGVTLTTTLIAGAVAANSVQAAPVGLATKISAMAGKTTMTTSTTAIVKGTMKTMLWNNFRTAVWAGAVIVLAAGTMTLFAQHPETPVAKIPYKMLEDGWLFQESINPTNLTFHFLIDSHKKGVQAQDIHLMIHSSSKGNIPVRLGARGMLLDFPCDDDLRQENPYIVSDQPKGTLGLGLWVYVPRPEGLTFRYDHLANAVDEANQASVRASQMAKTDFGQAMPMFPATVNAIGLNFPKASAGKANVTIATAEGPKNYVADSHGLIKLKINPKLKAENPEMIFSERPDWIGIGQF